MIYPSYTKQQQDIVAWITADTERGVYVYHDTEKHLHTFFHPDGSHGYTVPDCFLGLDTKNCKRLDRMPYGLCTATDEDLRLKPTGHMVEQNKHVLVEFYDHQDRLVYFNKRLLDKIGKKVKLYQPTPLAAATIVDADLNVVVGYLCPVRYKTENQ